MARKFKFAKPSNKPRKLKRYILSVKKPKHITYWKKADENVDMLIENLKLSRLTPVLADRESKMGHEMCIVAAVHSHLKAEKSYWTPTDVEEIKSNGIELHRRTRFFFKLTMFEANRIRPNCIYPNFYIGNNLANIIIGPPCSSIETINEDWSWLPDFINHTKENNGIILTSSNKKCLSFWFKKMFFCYSPPQGYGKNMEYSFLLRSSNLQKIFEYVNHIIPLVGPFQVYCLKILNIQPVEINLEKVYELRDKMLLESCKDFESKPISDEKDLVLEEEKKDLMAPGKPTGMDDIDRACALCQIPFGKDYVNSFYPDRGFLSGSDYCKHPEKILHTNIAAAIYLYHIRSLIWNRQAVDDILKLGDTLYKESEEKEIHNHNDWTQRISLPITFGAKNFNIIFEKIVFGEITTEETHIFGIKHGLLAFFKTNDFGIIYGPQIQLIWQESGFFFTFCPKERDSVGRKWTRSLSTRLTAGKDDSKRTKHGAACVSWFKDIITLSDAYIANVILKHRKDPYRICKLKIVEKTSKSEDFKEWKAFGDHKWRIIGDKTICNFIKPGEASMLFPKAFCIGCANSLYAKVINVDDWTVEDIDKILNFGNEYYKESIALKPNLKETFNYKDLKKTFVLFEKRFQVVIVPDKFVGSVFYSKGNSIDLLKGLKLFYDDYQYGLIVIKDKAIPMFQDNTYFHIIFPYDKFFGKTETCFCSPESIYSNVYGHAFALRFKHIPDMHDELINMLNMSDEDRFSLYIIEGKDRPPLMNYSKFGENAAILRPNDELHEGHIIFNVRADKQTYANLLIALCYVTISRPLEWSRDDVTDILRIGDEIFCKIIANLLQCEEVFYKLELNKITPVIGWNKFTFTESPVDGVFKYIPPFEEEDEDEESELDSDAESADTTAMSTNQKEDKDKLGEEEEVILTTDLKQTLDSWETAEIIYAILDSKLFKIALWKRDLVYFVFDPKASTIDGSLTRRRLERAAMNIEHGQNYDIDLRYIENDGTAYVAYFYDLESFVDHIMSKVPEEYVTESFTLNTISIKSQPVPTAELEFKKPHNITFIAITPNMSTIRASISQDETMFQHPNKQEAANCLVALAFAFITNQSKWSIDLLNIILKYGDRLYVKSLEILKQNEPDRLNFDELTLNDITKIINIYKVKFQFRIAAIFTNCFVPNAENKELKKVLTKMANVDAGSGAVLKIKGFLNAIWRQGNNFYLFDPFKSEPTGMPSNNGVAYLMRFNKVDVLMDFMVKKFLCRYGSNNFELSFIEIQKTMPLTLPGFYTDKFNFVCQMPSNQAVFQDIGNDMKVLKKTFILGEKPIKFLCLGALLNSRLEYVEIWNYSVFEKIVLLGDFLKHQLECKTLVHNDHLEDINFSVKVDNILCNILVNHVIQVSLLSETDSKNLNMKQGLESFFNDRSNCIITGGNRCYAIWKDGPKYYLFWFRHIDTTIFVQSANDWKPFYDIIMDDVETSNNAYHIKNVQITRIILDEEPCTTQSGKDGRKVEECRKCGFNKFVEKIMKENEVRTQMNRNFKPYQQGVDILCGDLIKYNEYFDSFQYFETLKASCLIAAAMCLIQHPSTWNRNIINDILKSGVYLYKSSVAVSKTLELDITEFQQSFDFKNFNMLIMALPPTKETHEIENLVPPLLYILRKHKIGYITVPENYCMTIIMDEKDWYLFYPGSPRSHMEDPDNEKSCLIRFESLLKLITFIVVNKSTEDSVYVGPIIARIVN